MSLQPGINPLDIGRFSAERGRFPTADEMKKATGMGHLNLTEEQKAKMLAPLLKRPDLDGSGPGMITAREARENQMGQGIPNMGGFDPGDLMARPEIRQEETRNQANMVSAPYEEANRMAAEKTNPMNEESQNPGKVFLMKFIGK